MSFFFVEIVKFPHTVLIYNIFGNSKCILSAKLKLALETFSMLLNPFRLFCSCTTLLYLYLFSPNIVHFRYIQVALF